MAYPVEYKNKVLETKEKENLTVYATCKKFGISIFALTSWMTEKENTKPSSGNIEAVALDFKTYPYDHIADRVSRLNISTASIYIILRQLKEKHNQ
jgi:hypothetical protein